MIVMSGEQITVIGGLVLLLSVWVLRNWIKARKYDELKPQIDRLDTYRKELGRRDTDLYKREEEWEKKVQTAINPLTAKTAAEELRKDSAALAPKEDLVGTNKSVFSKFQRFIMILAAFAMLMMLLYPPWVYRVNVAPVHVQRNAGYGLIFTPPTPNLQDFRASVVSVGIDTQRLIIQVAATILAAMILVYVFQRRP